MCKQICLREKLSAKFSVNIFDELRLDLRTLLVVLSLTLNILMFIHFFVFNFKSLQETY